MSVHDRAYQLQIMLAKNKRIEALEEFYHENVTVIEMPTGETRIGKQAQREAVLYWMGAVAKVHKRGLYSLCVDDERNITSAETWIDVTYRDGERVKIEEVAIQHWQEGQIIEEKFYYHLPE